MMPEYLRTPFRAPARSQERPSAAEIRQLERFLVWVDDQLAAHNARVALGMATNAIALAARKPEVNQ